MIKSRLPAVVFPQFVNEIGPLKREHRSGASSPTVKAQRGPGRVWVCRCGAADTRGDGAARPANNFSRLLRSGDYCF
jgi:hypothetical protein